MNIAKIQDLIYLLGFEYQRLSMSGQATLNELSKEISKEIELDENNKSK